jgi:hypothetical protein
MTKRTLTLYLVTRDLDEPYTVLLRKACRARGVRFVVVDPTNFDYTHPPKLDAYSLLYRPDIEWTRSVERFLVRPNTTTFYKSYERALTSYPGSYVVLRKADIPTPKTIDHVSADRTLLERYVKYLGGFPIILKATGLSHGVGVIKVDSSTALYSLVDYLTRNDQHVIMREFVDTNRHARLIVVGNRVVDSIEYKAPRGDFRTNVGKAPKVKPKKFSKAIEATAVQSVHAMGLEFGGVDIVMDSHGRHYVLEVNFPAFFPRAQHITGTDIAGYMVDFLIDKNIRTRQDN